MMPYSEEIQQINMELIAIALVLHALLETPTAVNFLLNPSNQLLTPHELSHPFIR